MADGLRSKHINMDDIHRRIEQQIRAEASMANSDEEWAAMMRRFDEERAARKRLSDEAFQASLRHMKSQMAELCAKYLGIAMPKSDAGTSNPFPSLPTHLGIFADNNGVQEFSDLEQFQEPTLQEDPEPDDAQELSKDSDSDPEPDDEFNQKVANSGASQVLDERSESNRSIFAAAVMVNETVVSLPLLLVCTNPSCTHTTASEITHTKTHEVEVHRDFDGPPASSDDNAEPFNAANIEVERILPKTIDVTKPWDKTATGFKGGTDFRLHSQNLEMPSFGRYFQTFDANENLELYDDIDPECVWLNIGNVGLTALRKAIVFEELFEKNKHPKIDWNCFDSSIHSHLAEAFEDALESFEIDDAPFEWNSSASNTQWENQLSFLGIPEGTTCSTKFPKRSHCELPAKIGNIIPISQSLGSLGVGCYDSLILSGGKWGISVLKSSVKNVEFGCFWLHNLLSTQDRVKVWKNCDRVPGKDKVIKDGLFSGEEMECRGTTFTTIGKRSNMLRTFQNFTDSTAVNATRIGKKLGVLGISKWCGETVWSKVH